MSKTCSRCGSTKNENEFIKKRNICLLCNNSRRKELSLQKIIDLDAEKQCRVCNITKKTSEFIKNQNRCKDCNNLQRRQKYNSEPDHRKKLIEDATNHKKRKLIKKRKIIEDERIEFEEKHGSESKLCKYCNGIKLKTRFRKKRLKCMDCERDEPIIKFIRTIRSRIFAALKHKSRHTVEYLGCTAQEYIEWITTDNYTLENRGKVWHVDHVIPLSKFDLTDENQQNIAFNWRNTMALSASENLSKNNKINDSQIKSHWNKLLEYHTLKQIKMPQEFIDLYAKHLDAGNPLEPQLLSL